MSIASAITNAQGKVANAYTAVSGMGGTLPQTQNLSNLPTAIESIPNGDTITAVNTTGSAISESDKVWIQKSSFGGFNFVLFSSVDNLTLTGFASENIAVDAEGDAATVLPQKLNVSVTVDTNDATIFVE